MFFFRLLKSSAELCAKANIGQRYGRQLFTMIHL